MLTKARMKLISKVRTFFYSVWSYILLLLLSAGAVWTAYLVPNQFSDNIIAAEKIDDVHRVLRGGTLTGKLFVNLVNAGHISFNSNTGEIDLNIDCGAYQAGLIRDSDDKLISRLCAIDLGADIRAQIARWNNQASLVAVRDNRSRGEACTASQITKSHYVPRGCHPNKWSGRLQRERDQFVGKVGSFVTVNRREEPAAEVYGFLAREGVEGFGDWRRFPNPEGVIKLTTDLEIGRNSDRRVSIDYIGKLISVEAVQAGTNNQPLEPASITVKCARFRSEDKCVEELADPENFDLPQAGRITYDLPKNWKGNISLTLSRSVALQARIRNLKRANFLLPKDSRRLLSRPSVVINITQNIQAKCRQVSNYTVLVGADGTEFEIPRQFEDVAEFSDRCVLHWRLSELSTQQPPVAADDVEAAPISVNFDLDQNYALAEPALKSSIDQSGPSVRISEDAIELGLAPILGYDDTDPFGLLGILDGQQASSGLTIDPVLQKHTLSVLDDVLQGNGSLATQTALLLPNRSTLRKASVLLLDAGPINGDVVGDFDTGRILSVASWPQPQRNISQWDVEAQSSFRPTENPMAARAWSQNNRFYAPGSAFKPAIAITAINRAANGDETVGAYLGGTSVQRGLTGAELRQVVGDGFGFSFNSTALTVPRFSDGRKVQDMRIGNRGVAMCAHIRGTNCAADSRLTFKDMLAQSDNVYFARLALLIDRANVSVGRGNSLSELLDTNTPDGADRHHINEMMQRLLPKDGVSLLPGLQNSKFSRLHTSEFQVDSATPEHPRLYRLALNGIGQSAQATPLGMSLLAASISAGKIVRPWIAGDPSSLPTPQSLFYPAPSPGGGSFDPGAADEMLQTLRDGMSDVVKVGTAANAYRAAPEAPAFERELRDKTFGKTGTAQIGNPAQDGNTAWFIGWVDGASIAGYEDRRLAFACMISHIRTSGAGGGTVCAPVIRELFLRLPRSASGGEGGRDG